MVIYWSELQLFKKRKIISEQLYLHSQYFKNAPLVKNLLLCIVELQAMRFFFLSIIILFVFKTFIKIEGQLNFKNKIVLQIAS